MKKYESFPELLSIELTSACNAHCIMCPRSSMTRNIKHMETKILDKIILDCKNKPLKKINLFWFGDSLCNPEFKVHLRKIRKELPNVKLYLSTNAELLNESMSDEILLNNLLDVINFDIDGVTKETYEKIRVGVDFDRVLKNIKYFFEKKKSLNNKKMQTRVTIIKMRETIDEIDEFKKYWNKFADKVDVNSYNTWLGSQEDKNVGKTFNESKEGSFKYPCIHPWQELVVSAEGIAGLCCLDYDLTAKLGSVMENNIENIWNNEKMRSYRQIMIALKYNEIDCCSKCNAYIYQDDKFWARLWS